MMLHYVLIRCIKISTLEVADYFDMKNYHFCEVRRHAKYSEHGIAAVYSYVCVIVRGMVTVKDVTSYNGVTPSVISRNVLIFDIQVENTARMANTKQNNWR
ncbi:hypothetical protein WUBG_11622 [Wuchereria bancrofti]|uniref:Uncharacterized protein n=1 Tax=Wuchereria bancrofti TaxID=6293 RepID=J9ASS6_WUCBA|nr:hypothetical protein WUBG_11622 [Wuchereria bancrofti]